jgi:hypothetical protein
VDNLGFHQFEYLYYIVRATAKVVKQAQVFGTQAISIFVRLWLSSRLPQLLGVGVEGYSDIGRGYTVISDLYLPPKDYREDGRWLPPT